MNLKQIKTIPYMEKKLLVAEACLMYNKLKKMQSDPTRIKNLSDSLREGIMINSKSFSIMDSIFGLLNSEYEMIIRADFVEQEEKFWFLNHWSKSTYYRLKHEAVDEFLFLLYA